MIELARYIPDYKQKWDSVLTNSRNGTFLFYRNYMDYHADRFKDCSFLIIRNGNIEGIIPGNIEKDCFYSHQGLTYGGLITSVKITTKDTLETFEQLNSELKKLGVTDVVYKPVPLIYNRIPAQEDIYALYRIGAEKIGCNISSTIFQNSKPSFTESRKSGIRKCQKENVRISETKEFEAFWTILENNLIDRFNTKPVHSYLEMGLLSSRFPENIKLFVVKHNEKIVAGSILYIMNLIVHVQYISASEDGKKIGALDYLFDFLINKEFSDKPVFDFGQSTERMGQYLNENLIFQKEGFGGRGIAYEIYKYSI